MASQRGYKIRTYVNGKAKDSGNEWKNYSITVPSEIAEQIPDDLKFVPRMCSKKEDGVDGLLYEPFSEVQERPKKPDWLKNSNSQSGNGRDKATDTEPKARQQG